MTRHPPSTIRTPSPPPPRHARSHQQELDADPHVAEGHAGAVQLRAFRNAAGSLRGDLSEGCDSWAVAQGWAAVTPICLRSGAARGGGSGSTRMGCWRLSQPLLMRGWPRAPADMPLSAVAAAQREQPQLLLALAAALQAAAKHLGARVGGIPSHVEAALAAGAPAAEADGHGRAADKPAAA